ncbi:hypothetical protein BD626DRAFT_477916 [Schizophyllum amplum]|uniref:Uncharacterized protein n=1 Tax=Schizophyllum amplum TaxID=97359 RepID=A0A550D0L6_9AGAR|nr:hypothetical protein BD626DRAFT_477916 [Auriculariopsis ampla]
MQKRHVRAQQPTHRHLQDLECDPKYVSPSHVALRLLTSPSGMAVDNDKLMERAKAAQVATTASPARSKATASPAKGTPGRPSTSSYADSPGRPSPRGARA